MTLTAEEMIGLNSVLDGKKIWGFNESAEAYMDMCKKKKTASELLEYGEKGLHELLVILNTYKNADNYVVMNEYNIAVLNGKMLALTKMEDRYQFSMPEREQIINYIRRTDRVLLFHFRNKNICAFDIVSTENGRKFINSMMHKKKLEAGEKELAKLVERYLDKDGQGK